MRNPTGRPVPEPSGRSRALLPAVDRAAFATAFAARLRQHGLTVGSPAVETFTRALAAFAPNSITQLYWSARISLVHRRSELDVFDEVFAQVFAEATLAVDPNARRTPLTRGTSGHVENAGAGPGQPDHGRGDDVLPWSTLPTPVSRTDSSGGSVVIALRGPSSGTATPEVPFEHLDDAQLAQLEDRLRKAARDWPTRRSRRSVNDHRGRTVDLRETLRRARRTGWEPVHLWRSRPRDKPRRVVLLVDVSQSMQAQATAYLHLMRVLAVGARTEVFAFGTTLTRLTTVLNHRCARQAVDHATEVVDDRFGGTRIATNLRTLLSGPHANLTRGAIVLIASDGWDSDPPDELARCMARLHRRAHRVLWLNPRAGARDFTPRVAAMAAALPYCDALLPADTIESLGAVIAAITGSANR